jgi:hypothetical protein
MLALVIIVLILAAILSWPPISKLLRGLLGNRKELALFAIFLLVEVGLVAIGLVVLGPRVGFYVLIASVALFAIWVRPPAKPR